MGKHKQNKQNKRLTQLKEQNENLPTVSILTITQFNRFECLKILTEFINYQTYKNIIEWVIIEGSNTNDEIEKSSKQIMELASSSVVKCPIIYINKNSPTTKLGELRNIGNNTCKGDITVCMDDDDFYPKNRVEHAVEKLIKSDALIAGCSQLILYDYNLNKMYQSNGYGKYHSTNACMAWKKEYLKTNSHDSEKTFAEEQSFTKNFTEKLVQLDPYSTIIASSHNINTFNKKELLISTYRNNKFLREINQNVENLINKDILDKYKKIFLNLGNNIYDIVFFCGGFYRKWLPTDIYLEQDEISIIKLAENWSKLGKKVAIYSNVQPLTLNCVDYINWTHFPYEQNFKTVIIWNHTGLLCYAPFAIKAEKILIDMENCVLEEYESIFKRWDFKYDNIIVKSEYHKEHITKIKNIDVEKIIVIPNGIRYNNFINNNDIVVRNPYRFCYCNDFNKGFLILEKIWQIIYNYEPRCELHIYNVFGPLVSEEFINNHKNFLSSPGVMYHGNQSIEIITREKYLSKYDLSISLNVFDVDNMYIRESIVSGCIPIISNTGVYKNMEGHKINFYGDCGFVAINIIKLLKNNESIEKIITNRFSIQDDWENISKKWLTL